MGVVTLAGCGLDLQRRDGSLAVTVLDLEADVERLLIMIEHHDRLSKSDVQAAAEVAIERVPAGESWVSVQQTAPAVRGSNRIAVEIFAGEMTRVGIALVDDPLADPDADDIISRDDNCPIVDNRRQDDGDRDGVGDACDNCPASSDPVQQNFDADAFGDQCDPDDDNDRIPDVRDACPLDPGGIADDDADDVCDYRDNCPGVRNTLQTNCDGDAFGDACDTDSDDDGVLDIDDVCIFAPDPGQADSDGDGVGDACQDDPQRCRLSG